jgi:hypothetical protein
MTLVISRILRHRKPLVLRLCPVSIRNEYLQSTVWGYVKVGSDRSERRCLLVLQWPRPQQNYACVYGVSSWKWWWYLERVQRTCIGAREAKGSSTGSCDCLGEAGVAQCKSRALSNLYLEIAARRRLRHSRSRMVGGTDLGSRFRSPGDAQICLPTLSIFSSMVNSPVAQGSTDFPSRFVVRGHLINKSA